MTAERAERLSSELRAVSPPEQPRQYEVGPLVVDELRHEVTIAGRRVELTVREFALLAYLCQREGHALSREQLLAAVWGDGADVGRRTVDIHVRRLRAKLGVLLPLHTLRGVGYKLSATAPSTTP